MAPADTDERAHLLEPNHLSNGHDPNGHHSHDHDNNVLHAHTAESHTIPLTTLPIAPARRIAIISLLFSLAIALAICGVVATTAMLQALEDIICRRVHGPGFPRPPSEKLSFDDDPCKDAVVMGELTILTGWDAVFTLIPGLLLSVPYGAVADRYGRVPVLGLVLLGVGLGAAWALFVCLMDGGLDLRWIWFANFFQLLGGGAPVLMSMVYTMLADISTDAQRSTAFLYIGTFLMGGNLVAQPITYLAMHRGKWFAFRLGLTGLAVSTIIAFCIPETLDKTRAQQVDPVPPVEVQMNSSSSQHAKDRIVFLAKVRASTLHTIRVIRWLFWEQKLAGFLLLSLACEMLGKSVANAIQQQYISKRYRLTFAEASLVDTVGLVTTVVVLSVVLPYCSHLLLTTYGWSARAKDLRLAQASAIFTAVGCLLIGISSTLLMVCVSLVVFSLGTGYTYLIRGLMTSLVGAKDLGLLYASVSVVETISLLFGMPSFSYLFKFGMHWGGGWIGLPYYVGGLILVGAGILVAGVRRTYIDVSEELDSLGSGASGEESGEEEGVATV